MTVEESCADLATSWQEYVNQVYEEILKKSLDNVLKKSNAEGISDLKCIIIKVPIILDFSHLIDYNPEFYDYFNSAGPDELKGLVRESVLRPFQEMIANIDSEIIIDKRQISVELFMKNLPCSTDVILESKDFYQSAIPLLCSDNLDLKGSWNSQPKILIGKVFSISESFYVNDIKTFACSNPRCKNNQRVIRHVGLDHLEQLDELGPNEIKPEVFISSSSSTSTNPKTNISIKCHNCRERIEELYPFRSVLEFKIARIQPDASNSSFPIDILLIGSLACSSVKLSHRYNFIGYPKLTVEIPEQLKELKNIIKPFYFEAYGAEQVKCYNGSFEAIESSVDWLTSKTCEGLRLLFIVLICQIIGSANDINFSISLLGINEQVMKKISKILNVIFDSDNVIGYPQLMLSSKMSMKHKFLQMTEQSSPYLVNIIQENGYKKQKMLDTSKSSFIYINNIPNDQSLIIPVNFTSSEEANILLNDIILNSNVPKINIPINDSEIILSDSCAKSLQKYFLHLRSTSSDLPVKFSLNLLTKLCQISALNNGRLEADQEDAEFSILVHKELWQGNYELELFDHGENGRVLFSNQIMSPSTSFDFYQQNLKVNEQLQILILN